MYTMVVAGVGLGDAFEAARLSRRNSAYALFPARGNPEQAFSGWSKCKRAFDQLCPIAPWTLLDLRRTVATNLAGLGTPPM